VATLENCQTFKKRFYWNSFFVKLFLSFTIK
jgi:hypothetical protein